KRSSGCLAARPVTRSCQTTWKAPPSATLKTPPSEEEGKNVGRATRRVSRALEGFAGGDDAHARRSGGHARAQAPGLGREADRRRVWGLSEDRARLDQGRGLAALSATGPAEEARRARGLA